MNDKLDKILHSVKNLTLRNEELEKTIYDERLDELEGKFNIKFEEIDIRLEDKAETSELEILQAKLATIEESIEEQERTAVMQESYEKRLNIYQFTEYPNQITVCGKALYKPLELSRVS